MMSTQRRKSGSIEGGGVSPTASGPNLIAALSAAGISSVGSGDSTNAAVNVGTWKLIKGKVTQTIEEIKSSKHPQSQSHSQSHPHQQPQHPSGATSVIPIIVADTTSGARGVAFGSAAAAAASSFRFGCRGRNPAAR
ncbi:uncharacterized protein Dwil_GK27842 [Drosophila willistoni]|uniref:Uncharacterized protein n=1 Tax=Drosophila willistoni TaxID=7260 RepID=A0A0Q9WZ77_DROWI|nr:uncharacterized protein Dwil_GK27842 [Drosophila willistoni]